MHGSQPVWWMVLKAYTSVPSLPSSLILFGHPSSSSGGQFPCILRQLLIPGFSLSQLYLLPWTRSVCIWNPSVQLRDWYTVGKCVCHLWLRHGCGGGWTGLRSVAIVFLLNCYGIENSSYTELHPSLLSIAGIDCGRGLWTIFPPVSSLSPMLYKWA